MRAVLSWAVVAASLLAVASCAPNLTGKAKVEAKLKEAMKFKDVTLTEEADGTYKGTATDTDGTKYELTVTPEGKAMKVKGKNEKGDYKGGIIKDF
jgi:hypothetical protein